MEALVSAKDIATEFNAHYRTVVRKAREGKIPHYKDGKLLRFDREEVRKAWKRG